MSNVQVDLPVPAGNGTGAAVDTSLLGPDKTIVVGGTFVASVTVEISEDGVDWAPLASFTSPGDMNLTAVAQQMRVRIDAFGSGTPNVDVGADGAGGQFAAMNVPAGDGNGTNLNTKNFGRVKTVVVGGTLGGGSLSIQASEDLTSWSDVASFTVSGNKKTFEIEAQYMRVTRINTTGGTPTVTIGASNDAEGIDGGIDVTAKTDGGTLNVYVDSVNGDDGNTGLSITSALATLTGLYTRFPLLTYQRSTIVVHLAGVGGFGASATAVADYDTTNILYGGGGGTYGGTYVYKGPQMVAVTPTTGPATAALDVVPVVAVIGGSAAAGGTRSSRFDFTTAAPAWTVNDFRNKHLRITRAGALVIYEAPIASNTADTITVMKNGLAAAADAILASDIVEIVEGGARFINTTAAALDFDQCRISGVGTADWDVTDSAPNPAVGGMTFQRVQFRTAPIVRGALSCEFDRCEMGTGNMAVADSSVYFVSCSAEGVTLHNSTATDAVPLPNPDSGTSPIVANRAAFMDLQTHYLNVGDGNSPASYWTFNGMGFAGTPNGWNLVFVGPKSYLQCTGDMQGIAGNQVGIRAAAGGHCEVLSNSTAGRTSVEGSAGNLIVGPAGSGTVAYGTAAGEFEEVAGFAGNLQRFPITPGDLGDASVITTQVLF